MLKWNGAQRGSELITGYEAFTKTNTPQSVNVTARLVEISHSSLPLCTSRLYNPWTDQTDSPLLKRHFILHPPSIVVCFITAKLQDGRNQYGQRGFAHRKGIKWKRKRYLCQGVISLIILQILFKYIRWVGGIVHWDTPRGVRIVSHTRTRPHKHPTVENWIHPIVGCIYNCTHNVTLDWYLTKITIDVEIRFFSYKNQIIFAAYFLRFSASPDVVITLFLINCNRILTAPTIILVHCMGYTFKRNV